MTHFYTNAVRYALAHKVISAAVLLAVIGGGWWIYHSSGSTTATRYVLGTAAKGTIVASVTGSGQVEALSQVTLSSKTSGDVVAVNVQAGQEVKAGTLLAQVNATDALFNLQTAQISYDKLTTVDPQDLKDAQDAVTDAYASARATLTKASTDMSDTLGGLQALLSGYISSTKPALSDTAQSYISKAKVSYYDANTSYAALIKSYRTLSDQSGNAEVSALVGQSYDTALALAQAAKYAQDAVTYVRDHDDSSNSTTADSAYTSVVSLANTANSVVSTLASTRSTITKNDQTLADLVDGPDVLDLRSAQLSLQQKQEAVDDQYVRAPFDGIVASVDVSKGDTINSGSTVATFISKTQTVTLSLNEVDAAKVAVGNKATLTFDAIDGLTLTGTVAQIDSVGTVSQGVVSYTLKISFDSQDDRVKPGMTVNAAIQTEVHQDVIVVPSSAVKTQNGASYMQVFTPALADTGGTAGVASAVAPQQVEVTTGISDDTNVEILSGLTEGEQIVTRTISGTATTNTTTTSTRSAVGGGAIRF